MNTKRETSSKGFNQRLINIRMNGKTLRDDVQYVIDYGMLQYAEHGNTVFLTKAMQACVGVKSLPTQTIKEYIKAQANVVYIAIKNKVTGAKEHVFKKDGENVEVKLLDVEWYNWVGAKHQATADMDETAQIKVFFTKLKKNLKDGKIKNPEHAMELAQVLANVSFLKSA